MTKSTMARISKEMDDYLNQMSANLGISKTDASKLLVLQNSRVVINGYDTRKRKRGLSFGDVMRL